MNAKDLMIGDWVTFKDCQYENPMPIKIVAVGYQADTENDCLVQICKDSTCDIIEIDDEIVGIPLTPEILEKNGFSLDEYGEWYECEVSMKERNYWVNVAFRNDSVSVYDLDILTGGRSSICIHKNYVHELQHALRLCGIEKTIEL